MAPRAVEPIEPSAAAQGRVVVTGPESTGKTTIAQQLAVRFDAAWVPEYAREYSEFAGRTLAEQDVEPIARGQMALQDAALRSDHPLLVFDTDLVSTVVYARHYYAHCPEWIVSAARKRLANLYLLLDVDVAWTADGVRDQPQARSGLHDRFREQLRVFGARVVEIRGKGAQRLESAVQATRRHLVSV